MQRNLLIAGLPVRLFTCWRACAILERAQCACPSYSNTARRLTAHTSSPFWSRQEPEPKEQSAGSRQLAERARERERGEHYRCKSAGSPTSQIDRCELTECQHFSAATPEPTHTCKPVECVKIARAPRALPDRTREEGKFSKRDCSSLDQLTSHVCTRRGFIKLNQV